MTADAQQRLQQLERAFLQDKETRESLQGKITEIDMRKEQLDQAHAQLVERQTKMREYVTQHTERLNHSREQLQQLQESNRQAR